MEKMIVKRGLVLLAAGFLLLSTSAVALAKNPMLEVFVIGDSLSDPGNLFPITGNIIPPSPPYAQRYSNGPVWTEYFAADMAIPVDSRAYGGALSGVFQLENSVGGVSDVSNFNSFQYPIPGLPGVAQEIEQLFQEYPQGLNPRALYVIWSGANDFFLGLTLMDIYNDPAKMGITLEQTLANIASSVCRLSAGGARHFAVGNMPDIGLTPFARAMGPDMQQELSYVIASFNSNLTQVLNNLPEECAETMVILDSYQILHDVVDDPEFFGLNNVTDACLTQPGGPGTDYDECAEPDRFLFWDDVHPTTSGQAIFAEEFRAAFCGTGDLTPGLRGRSNGQPPAHWRGVCYGTKP